MSCHSTYPLTRLTPFHQKQGQRFQKYKFWVAPKQIPPTGCKFDLIFRPNDFQLLARSNIELQVGAPRPSREVLGFFSLAGNGWFIGSNTNTQIQIYKYTNTGIHIQIQKYKEKEKNLASFHCQETGDLLSRTQNSDDRDMKIYCRNFIWICYKRQG